MRFHSGSHALILGGGCAIGRHLAVLLLQAGRQVTVTVSAPERCDAVAAEIHAGVAGQETGSSVAGSCAAPVAAPREPHRESPALQADQAAQSDVPGTLRVVPLALEDAAVRPGAVDAAVAALCRNGTYAPPLYVADCMHPRLEGYVSAVSPEAAGAYFSETIQARHAILHELTRHMLASRSRRNSGNGTVDTLGRLLYLSSTAAGVPNAGQGLYAAAKCAAESLYRSIGIELAPRGITTAILRAGYVAAGRGQAFLAAHPEVVKGIPLGRALTAEEVAAALFWLLGDQASGINATAITMDGGMTACK